MDTSGTTEHGLFGAVDDGTETLRAAITRVMYDENGYVIARANVQPNQTTRDGKAPPRELSIKGNITDPMLGQVYEFTGKLDRNEKYGGFDFSFHSYRTILPSDTDGIATYLIDRARWVGPRIAKRLIDTFGSDTLSIIRDEPERVASAQIEGLTDDRIAEMRESLQKNAEIEAATVECHNLLGGVLKPAQIGKAVKKWGGSAAAKIKENPFILTELWGVGFVSADQVHTKLGGKQDDPNRLQSAVRHVMLEFAAHKGHTAQTQANLGSAATKLVGPSNVIAAMDESYKNDIVCVGDNHTVYLPEYREAEQYIANKIEAIKHNPSTDQSRTHPRIDRGGLADDQIKAVDAFERVNIFCLVGAPGTGKTYTVARIVKSMEQHGKSVSLCAPTGKAAKQMSQALGREGASTIHSLLQPTVDEDGNFSFSRDENTPLECDLIIIDEFSMVDVSLARSLFRAIHQNTRVLIVGDHYQLPSVGPGAVLRDILASGAVPKYELTEIKRNAGMIVKGCHAIKDGKNFVPESSDKLDLENGKNWRHIEAENIEQIKLFIEILYRRTLDGLGLSPLSDVQLIAATNERGGLSCKHLNELVKNVLNPRISDANLSFAVGDKVVRLKNENVEGYYVKGDDVDGKSSRAAGDKVRVVNGDIGIVKSIDKKKIHVRFSNPERETMIRRSEHHLRLAYCLTCHKMQGSESPVIILPLHKSMANTPIANREWLYTAISRAKKFIVTIGDIEAMKPMIARVGMGARITGLGGLLK